MKAGQTYKITGDGKVLSVTSNWRGYGEREMTQTLNSDGYLSVRLIIAGKRRRMSVHKLVALEFIGHRPVNTQIRHLDGNKLNNHKDNIAYGTALENAMDREKHGKTSRGLIHSQKIKQGIYARS